MADTDIQPLGCEQLIRQCDLSTLTFTTTDELTGVDLMATQKRAVAAIDFGVDVNAPGFNLFVIGASRDSMDDAVKALLEERAKSAPAPNDWVYLNNFNLPHRPIAMDLPAARGVTFRDAMRDLVRDFKVALPAAFESDDYQARRTSIDQAFREKQENAFKALREEADADNIAIIKTPFGFTLAPTKEGQVLHPEEFTHLPDDEKTRMQEAIQKLEKKLEDLLRSVPDWDKQRRADIRTLNQETTKNAVGHLIDDIKHRFEDLPKIVEHLEQVRADLIENVGFEISPHEHEEENQENDNDAVIVAPFDRYEVNLLVSQPADRGAPVIEELHPTLANLVGRVEHMSRQGVLVTNFRLIQPGALHRANGGYLLLDARAVLIEPFAWSTLKRLLKAKQIRIESATDLLSLTSTISLQPDPIPLQVKIILFGERLLYYLLSAADPEFAEYFKVLADFDDTLDRGTESEATYAQLIATLARQRKLRPLERDAVARAIERAARLAGDAAKLTLVAEHIGDLLVEADFWARKENSEHIRDRDIDRAIAEQINRAGRIREQMQESILRDIALIDTTGRATGQVNGLSVIELGGAFFGRPSRITARVSPGTGRVVDIEREVELGGPIHSKGVLILSGFISGRYALDAPISLLASLVFEQSYGGVEGDSASSAELYALLSALADVPLRQDLAVTGSVNQYGMVQAIGGVNDKIEGFFDICNARGLTGNQGVLIPAANVQHLMLREDVIAACAAQRFSVYSITTIDQGIALMTGLPAGERGPDGTYPEGTINNLVENRLIQFARARQHWAHTNESRDP